MQFVTRIDISKYKCVSEHIVTDEVVITVERIQHIKDRHPNDFEQYEKYIRAVIEQPDYILEANKPNTAFLLKSFTMVRHFEVVNFVAATRRRY